MSGKKKLLAALMCLLLLCALCLPALAEEVEKVKYIEYKWDGKKLTSEEKTCTATKLTGDEETLETGWYVAEDTLTYDSRLTVSGDVHLILADGCDIKANKGITVNEGTAADGKANTLSIYAQSEDNNMGALTVSGQFRNAGIGGTVGNSSGLITIHGGTVTATSDFEGAGIGGGGSDGQCGDGTVTIYGGTVTATANYGAGIGGGMYGEGKVEIYGGKVTATANDEGAGIGGGSQGSGTVAISGGTVTATTNGRGAGIGGGAGGSGTVEIYGGTVSAITGNASTGAGIGSGYKGEGRVEIHGGTVTATASGLGAAIGNGYGSSNGSVTVKGGRVSAVHTTKSMRSIGGSNCAVSLGWKDADDYVTAAGYEGNVQLTKDFLIAGTTDTLQAGPVEISKIAGQVLLPNRSRTVRCIGYEWDEGKKRLTRKIHTVTNPRPLTGLDTVLTGGDSEDNAVWYRVSGAVTLSARPEVRGHVHLILMDGCDLRAEKGITVNEGNFLSIFAQSDGANMGALTVPGQGRDAGIGGTEGNHSGLITIHGGKIEAASNSYGAGIGGGGSRELQGGSGYVTIYGGTVTATAMEISDGAGIGGGGSRELQGGSGYVTIYGGTVTATAKYGAGIGGGYSYNAQGGTGTVTIYGGTVTAETSGFGAGIGGGEDGEGKVTIYGGTVTATAKYGAGIGGGSGGSGTVTIYGGTVSATASGEGAAIGGGYKGDGKVTIEGGTVTVTSNDDGAGIGGGRNGNGTVTIEGGTVTATASGKGAAIGNGWYGSDGSVTITGGSVSAVHTTQSHLSIGGELGECTVSLGLTKKNDSVYAAGYATKDDTVTLTAALQDAGTGEEFLAGGVPVGDVARKLLIPNTPEAARQYAWSGAAFRLPGSLTGIGKGAFQGIRAATVLVPQTVKKIGADAFRGSGVKRIRFENGNPEVFDESAFEGCPFVIVYTPAQGSVYDALKDDPKIYIISK